MSKKAKDGIIRVGDKVRILNPQMFVRCGYPMTVSSETEIVEKELGMKIAEFIHSVSPDRNFIPGLRPASSDFERLKSKIAREVAHYRCGLKGWGGRARQIYTREDICYLNQVCTVRGIRFVKTGEYEPASGGGYSYYGDMEDYEPPYLAVDKTHKILELDYSLGFSVVEIEASRVEKVVEVPVENCV
jgi:hypothetical protein